MKHRGFSVQKKYEDVSGSNLGMWGPLLSLVNSTSSNQPLYNPVLCVQCLIRTCSSHNRCTGPDGLVPGLLQINCSSLLFPWLLTCQTYPWSLKWTWLHQDCAVFLVVQLCPTLCNPMDYNLPGSSVHGDSPGKNTGVGCHALLQGIFSTQELNSGLPHCRRILYQLSYQGSKWFGEMWKQWQILFSWDQKSADGDCSHEIKRHLLLERKAMENLDVLEHRDITSLTKIHIVKVMGFPVVMCGCES